ncbi:MAG: hypothetical protein AAFQ02_11490, partial [Bacteroidota bacterium]
MKPHYTLLTVIALLLSTQITKAQTTSSMPPEDKSVSVQASITKAVNQAVKEGDEVRLHNPNFQSYFNRQGVSLTPHGSDMKWSWELQQINGTDAAATTPILREEDSRELVDYKRGGIIERYVFHRDNLEQQFILQEKPEEGALTIEGTIYADGTFSQQKDHWLWSNAHNSVKLGQLYVYDANGDEIEANYTVKCDYAAITIDEEALAEASYPVTIDPEIGPDDFRISVMGPDDDSSFNANQPAIAYNSTDDNYLAVWLGDEAEGGLADDEFEIYGQVINADGSLFGQRFRISFQGDDGNSNFDAATPSVAYNSEANNFFVVWRGDDNQGQLVDDEFEIYGQLISNLGQLVGMNLRVSEMGVDGNAAFDASNPDVAYNPAANNFMVVWHGNDVTVGQLEIHGQLIAADGTKIDDSFQISNQGVTGNNSFDAFGAAVTYNSQDNEYLVVWEGDSNVGQLVDNEGEIYGQLLTATGDEIGNDFRISQMGIDGDANRDAQRADVAYNAVDNNYLVVWFGDDISNNNTQVHGQLIAADGAEIGQDDFRLSSLNPDNFNINPSVSFSPQQNKFLVTWTSLPTMGNLTNMRTFGQYVDADGFSLSIVPNGFFISAAPVPPAGSEVFASAVAYNSTDGNFLTVWSAEITNGEFEILGQLISELASRNLDEHFRISFQGPDGNEDFNVDFPAVAYNTVDNNYLVVWHGVVNGNSTMNKELEILGQLVSSQGFFIGQPFRISDMGPDGNFNFDAFAPSIVYNALDNEYLVVWRGDDNSNG